MTATADITVNYIENALLIPNAALRFSPPVPKKKTDSGGLIDKLIPRRRRRPATGNGADRKGAGQERRVWVLTEHGEQPVSPVPVKTGFTDGSFTAIDDGSLEPGQRVIIGMETVVK